MEKDKELFCENCGTEREIRKALMSNGNPRLKYQCPRCGNGTSRALSFKMVDDILKVTDFDLIGHELFISEAEDKRYLEYEAKQIEYNNYINSFVWKNVRLKRINIDNRVCLICENIAEEVHHLTYKNFKDENQNELVSLCRNCHKMHHTNSILFYGNDVVETTFILADRYVKTMLNYGVDDGSSNIDHVMLNTDKKINIERINSFLTNIKLCLFGKEISLIIKDNSQGARRTFIAEGVCNLLNDFDIKSSVNYVID